VFASIPETVPILKSDNKSMSHFSQGFINLILQGCAAYLLKNPCFATITERITYYLSGMSRWKKV